MGLPYADETRQHIADIVAEFPEATSTLVVGLHLKLEVRGKTFGWFMEDHNGDGRLALNFKAYPGVAQAKVAEGGVAHHIPKYVGHRGWLGIWLDSPAVDWNEVNDLLFDAYALTAPKSLLKTFQ